MSGFAILLSTRLAEDGRREVAVNLLILLHEPLLVLDEVLLGLQVLVRLREIASESSHLALLLPTSRAGAIAPLVNRTYPPGHTVGMTSRYRPESEIRNHDHHA